VDQVEGEQQWEIFVLAQAGLWELPAVWRHW
jgi:hypothetical protein